MRVWKRRVVALVAVSAGSAGLLMSSAGAQTGPPTSVPTFSIPDPGEFPEFPEFPTFPTFTVPTMPPPTMPPSTSSTTSPPPTKPPSTSATTSPPPTMPPTTIGLPTETEEQIEDAISRIEQFGEEFSQIVEDLRAILDLF
jgi:hypothetical protein